MPPIVIEGWRRLSVFPVAAREPFWRLLTLLLLQPGNPSHQNSIPMLGRQFHIEPDVMLAAIGCCELLLKQAAAQDLSEEQFQQDLQSLGGPEDLIDFIQAHFAETKKVLRAQILMETLAAHGKVMTDLQWRVDHVLHSSKGSRLDAEIVLLTLYYQEGAASGSVTLQLTQETARMLRRFCDRFDASH